MNVKKGAKNISRGFLDIQNAPFKIYIKYNQVKLLKPLSQKFSFLQPLKF